MVGSVLTNWVGGIVVRHLTTTLEDKVQGFGPSLRSFILSSHCCTDIRMVETSHRNSSGGGKNRDDTGGGIMCCLFSQAWR